MQGSSTKAGWQPSPSLRTNLGSAIPLPGKRESGLCLPQRNPVIDTLKHPYVPRKRRQSQPHSCLLNLPHQALQTSPTFSRELHHNNPDPFGKAEAL